MNKQINVSNDLKNLAEILKCTNTLYIVGGYVRNSILGITTNDIDLASATTPDELASVLSGTDYLIKEKSKKMGVVEILSPNGEVYEHATFRTESYPQASGTHSPNEVVFTSDIREDAKRRDFTMNCIYYDILRQEIIDIYSGVYDIEKRVIKCIETPEFVFKNDGERIVRLIRFACELNFRIERATFLMAKKMAYHLSQISGTRKYQELKLIMASPETYSLGKPNAYKRGLRMFNHFNIWANYYVPVARVRYNIVNKAPSNLKMFGLLIDIIDSVEPDCVEYYLQFLFGQSCFCESTKKTLYIINIVCGYFDALNQIGNKKYFTKYFENYEVIKQLLIKRSKRIYFKYKFFYNYIINHKLPIVVKDLKINGQHIKKHFPKVPEKKYKKILNDLLSKVFEGEIENELDVLLKEIKYNVNMGNY